MAFFARRCFARTADAADDFGADRQHGRERGRASGEVERERQGGQRLDDSGDAPCARFSCSQTNGCTGSSSLAGHLRCIEREIGSDFTLFEENLFNHGFEGHRQLHRAKGFLGAFQHAVAGRVLFEEALGGAGHAGVGGDLNRCASFCQRHLRGGFLRAIGGGVEQNLLLGQLRLLLRIGLECRGELSDGGASFAKRIGQRVAKAGGIGRVEEGVDGLECIGVEGLDGPFARLFHFTELGNFRLDQVGAAALGIEADQDLDALFLPGDVGCEARIGEFLQLRFGLADALYFEVEGDVFFLHAGDFGQHGVDGGRGGFAGGFVAGVLDHRQVFGQLLLAGGAFCVEHIELALQLGQIAKGVFFLRRQLHLVVDVFGFEVEGFQLAVGSFLNRFCFGDLAQAMELCDGGNLASGFKLDQLVGYFQNLQFGIAGVGDGGVDLGTAGSGGRRAVVAQRGLVGASTGQQVAGIEVTGVVHGEALVGERFTNGLGNQRAIVIPQFDVACVGLLGHSVPFFKRFFNDVAPHHLVDIGRRRQRVQVLQVCIDCLETATGSAQYADQQNDRLNHCANADGRVFAPVQHRGIGGKVAL